MGGKTCSKRERNAQQDEEKRVYKKKNVLWVSKKASKKGGELAWQQ